MPHLILAGPLIALLIASAGAALFGMAACLIAIRSGTRIRALGWLAVLCGSVACYQGAVVGLHLSATLADAQSWQRWHSISSTTMLLSSCAYLAAYFRQRTLRRIFIGLAALVLLSWLMLLFMPAGARFKASFASELMIFPWGERLQMLRGQQGWLAFTGRALYLGTLLWIAALVARTPSLTDRNAANVMTGAAACSLAAAVWSCCNGAGRKRAHFDFVYFGGFGSPRVRRSGPVSDHPRNPRRQRTSAGISLTRSAARAGSSTIKPVRMPAARSTTIR
jgi:hypothetical protein